MVFGPAAKRLQFTVALKPLLLSPQTDSVSAREVPCDRATVLTPPFASLISASSVPPRHAQPEMRPIPLIVEPLAGTSSVTSFAGSCSLREW